MRKQMALLLGLAMAWGAFPLAQAQPPSDSPAEYDPKKAKGNPELLVKERVDQILGRSTLSPDAGAP